MGAYHAWVDPDSVTSQAQQSIVPRFRAAASSLKTNLDAVGEVEKACREAKIDEIDLGASSVKDFQFELDLLEDTIRQKENFIENRMSGPQTTPGFDLTWCTPPTRTRNPGCKYHQCNG